MGSTVDFFSPRPAPRPVGSDLAGFLRGFSIEVVPGTAAKVECFRDILPAGARVYIAHIEGTLIEDTVRDRPAAGGARFPGHAALPGASARRAATATGSAGCTPARPPHRPEVFLTRVLWRATSRSDCHHCRKGTA